MKLLYTGKLELEDMMPLFMKHVDQILKSIKKGAIYRGIVEWNNLDVNTRNIESFNEFKSSQKKLMLDKTIDIVQ